jgi:hypothetical protein
VTPPKLASWLLLTLGCGSDLESIVGDLAEQYSSRSAAWYWRQVGYAIVVGVTHVLRQHWVLALRAVSLGGVVIGIASVLFRNLAYWLLPSVLPAPISPSSLPVLLLVVGGPALVAGWAIARLHRPHGAPFALAFAVVVVHVQLLPRLVFLVRNSLQHERFLPYLWAYVATMPLVIIIVVLGVLIGAVIAQSRTVVVVSDTHG